MEAVWSYNREVVEPSPGLASTGFGLIEPERGDEWVEPYLHRHPYAMVVPSDRIIRLIRNEEMDDKIYFW